MKFEDLKGMTFVSVERINEYDEDILQFISNEGRIFQQYHQQDCCESVGIEEIHGDLKDLVGSPIILANEVSSSGEGTYADSQTWTFYNLATIKGHVTVRWLGESNGYYSESVDFREVQNS